MSKQRKFIEDDIYNYFGECDQFYEAINYLLKLANGEYDLELFIEELKEYNGI